MIELKSIWDLWTDQLFGRRHGRDGDEAHCALGWIDYVHTGNHRMIAIRYTPEAHAAIARVARYVRTYFPETLDVQNGRTTRAFDNQSVIAAANNALRLTPEDFREIDRFMQIEEGMPQVEALVESAAQPEEVLA